jgi:NAD(P)-dependent dehydrogenase (short-subunit alcohol dehydrogenase family)
MGRAMALALSEAGFDVAAVDRNAAALGTLPAPIRPVAADLAEPDSFDTVVAETLRAFGRIDILVNNAGIGQAELRTDQRRKPIRFWEVTPEQWNRFLTVNATAPILLSRAVLPHMLKANSGRIITVTTSLGTMVREGYLLYGSSKAAAESAMAVLAADLKGTAITANVLVPGGVTDTPLVGDAGDRTKMLRPEIMLPPLLWLVSDAAAEVSGQRFIAADWNVSLPAALAAEGAGAPVAWLSIARMPIEPG